MLRISKTAISLVLAAFVCTALHAQTAWRDIYKVKKKDTVYGIATSYGLTVDELIAANPEMKAEGYVLKKGDTVFIPDAKSTEKSAKTALKTPGCVNVGVMLPLHDNDGDGRRMTEYYRGLLIACDSLKKAGVNVNLYAWNVNIDADIKNVFCSESKNLDIIFGPLYTKQVKPLADYCKANGIKLVIPFSTTADDVKTNSCVFQIYQTSESLNARAIEYFTSHFAACRTVFIACNDNDSPKTTFTSALAKALKAKGLAYKNVNLKAPDTEFLSAFAADRPNIVVLDTSRSPELNLVFRRLNDLTATAPSVQISMFGYVEWLMYEGVYRALYNKYDVFIPSTFYYYKGITRVAEFERNYHRWFGETMQEQYLPRFALTGFDHGWFFIRGLFDCGQAFDGTLKSAFKPLQTPLSFPKTSLEGRQNTAYELVHYKRDGVIETISIK
ncbi:MAG: ABC transporter substrate-binding protein [Prevotella sp.]|nr:ABC transporter substrate-binding protein [Prevotella sp.]